MWANLDGVKSVWQLFENTWWLKMTEGIKSRENKCLGW